MAVVDSMGRLYILHLWRWEHARYTKRLGLGCSNMMGIEEVPFEVFKGCETRPWSNHSFFCSCFGYPVIF